MTPSKTVLAFDVYGTLIDTAGVVTRLESLVGGAAEAVARMWREKQVEYAFRRALMRRYERFAVCIAEALDYTLAAFGSELAARDRRALLDAYLELPPFEDVAESLRRLSERDFVLYAFSNGARDAVEALLEAAGLRRHFVDVVSVDEIRAFKPDPAVYHHFLMRSGAEADDSWLISSNPFDVIGAVSAGLRAAWIKRSAAQIFDPLGFEPTLTVPSLRELGAGIDVFRASNEATP